MKREQSVKSEYDESFMSSEDIEIEIDAPMDGIEAENPAPITDTETNSPTPTNSMETDSSTLANNNETGNVVSTNDVETEKIAPMDNAEARKKAHSILDIIFDFFHGFCNSWNQLGDLKDFTKSTNAFLENIQDSVNEMSERLNVLIDKVKCLQDENEKQEVHRKE